MIKKVIVTILLSFLIFIIIDYSSYNTDWNELKKLHEKYGTYLIPYNYTWILDPDPYSYILSEDFFRKPINVNSKKEPIYIFGCSFAYGEKLSDTENFGYLLGEATKKPIYNFSFPGFSIQHTIYQLENMSFSNIPKPKYVIYVYMFDHIRRMYTKFMQPHEINRYPYYKFDKNKNLVFQKQPNFSLSNFYIVKKLLCYQAKYKAESKKYEKENFQFAEQHFLRINELLKEKFPDSQFIILFYELRDAERNYNWEKLKKEGINIIYTGNLTNEDLSSEKYQLPDSHPSKEAWKLLVPKFIKKTPIK